MRTASVFTKTENTAPASRQVLVVPSFQGSKLNYKDTEKSILERTKITQQRFDKFLAERGKRSGS